MLRALTLFLGASIIGAAIVGLGCSRHGAETAGAPSALVEQLERDGRWAEAAAAHRGEALRLGPERGDEHVKRAMVAYLMANRLEDAEHFAGEVLERDPKRANVLFYLGDSQRVMNEHERARATLERLLERDPGHVKGAVALSHVLLRLGKAQEALDRIDRVLQARDIGPDQRALAEIDAARALRRLGRKTEAADRLATVLEADPYSPVAIAEAAQVFALLGKQDLARGQRELHAWITERGHQLSSEDETKLYSTGASSREEAVRLALQSADRRDFLRALAELERLNSAANINDVAAVALGRLWLRLQRPNESLRVAENAGKMIPRSIDLSRIKADACRALGRIDDARSALRDASAWIAPGVAAVTSDRDVALDVHVTAGLLELEPGGSLENASVCFERASAAAPESWRPVYGAGSVALERGETPKALELFAAALDRLRTDNAGPADLRRWNGVAKGLAGDLRSSAREIMALVRESPGELENFKAFERVFGSKQGEPEVVRVLAMKAELDAKREAEQSLLRSLADAPFREAGSKYVAAGKLFLAAGNREKALDCLLLAADLDASDAESLRAAEAVLAGPRDLFPKLRVLRRVLERAPNDAGALEALTRAYIDVGVRLDEAEALAVRLVGVKPGAQSDRLLATVRERRKSV